MKDKKLSKILNDFIWSLDIKIILYLIMMFIIVVTLIVSLGRAISVGRGKTTTVTATVTDKQVKRVKANTDTYLVFTKKDNGEILVMQITDSLFGWRWNSADVYAGIEVGKTYKFTTRGSRNTFLSWYPNIYEYKLVDDWEGKKE